MHIKHISIFVLLMLISTASIPLSAQNHRLRLSVKDLEVKKINKSSYSVTFKVTYSQFINILAEDCPVPMMNEKYLIQGPLKNSIINEEDTLYSGKRIDFNGDGDFKDSYRIFKSGKKYFIGKQRVQPIIFPEKVGRLSGYQYTDGKKPRITNLAEGGAQFCLYRLTKRDALISFGDSSSPLKLLEFPNPNIQVSVIKTTDSFSTAAPSISGSQNHITYTNEQLVSDQAGSWARIVWSVAPLNSRDSDSSTSFSAVVSNIEAPFVVSVRVNIATERGIRLQSPSAQKEIR